MKLIKLVRVVLASMLAPKDYVLTDRQEEIQNVVFGEIRLPKDLAEKIMKEWQDRGLIR